MEFCSLICLFIPRNCKPGPRAVFEKMNRKIILLLKECHFRLSLRSESDVASAIVCQFRVQTRHTNRIRVPVCVPDSCHPNSLSYISKSMTSITQAQSRSTSISALYAILAPRPNAYPFTSPSCPDRWRGVVGGPPATIAVRGGQGNARPCPTDIHKACSGESPATRGQSVS